MTDARHSKESGIWYSPEELVEPARQLLGGFDLDPCSDAVANTIIKARHFYDANGLQQTWGGSVWINPPTPPKEWWMRLVELHISGAVPRAIYIAYSQQQLQQAQLWTPKHHMMSFNFCIPNRRTTYLTTAREMILKRRKALTSVNKELSAASSDAAPTALRNTVEKLRKRSRDLRVEFQSLKGMAPDTLVPGEQPPHSSAIVGLGVDGRAFQRAYRHLGACIWRA